MRTSLAKAFLIATALTLFLASCKSTGKSLSGLGTAMEKGSVYIKDDKTRARVQAGANLAKASGEWMTGIDVGKEIALGQTFALRVVEDYGAKPQPLAPDSVQRYVNMVGFVVAKQSTRPNLSFCFIVVRNDAPNAFACPGGFIIVTTGLLKHCRDEAELAGVLGHEIAHVSYKHGLKIVSRNNVLRAAMDFTSEWEDNKKFNDFVDQSYEALILNRFDQKDEYEADESGMTWAYRAGYNAAGLRSCLLRLKGAAHAKFFSTHPPADKRVQRINEGIGALKAGEKLPKMEARYQREVLSKL